MTPEQHLKDFQDLQKAANYMHDAAGSGGAGLRNVPGSSYGTGYLPPIPHAPNYRALSSEEIERLTESVRANVHHSLAAELQPVLEFHAAKVAQTEEELQNVRQAQAALENAPWYKSKGLAVGAAGLAGLAISDTAYKMVNNHRNAKMNQHIIDQDTEIAALKANASGGASAHAAPTSPKSGATTPPSGSEVPSTETGATPATAPQPKNK